MGNTDSKLKYRKAVIELTTKSQNIESNDENFWAQFWSEQITNIQDIFTLIPAVEIRALREEAPSNLSTLCVKIVQKIKDCSENSYLIEKNQFYVLNCIRLLTRLMPYIYEEAEWRGYFWSESPVFRKERNFSEQPLAENLLNSLISLLFVPDFTVSSHNKKSTSDDLHRSSIDTCEYIWEAGVGFSHPSPHNVQHDYNRIEILKLLLTAFSETVFLPPLAEHHFQQNMWISYFTSFKNQNALSIFTSLLNIIFSYDPVGYGLPYNYLMFTDSREALVEICCQVMCVCLEFNMAQNPDLNEELKDENSLENYSKSNLFISYISRIHRDEDFEFILKGFSRLLNNPMTQTFLPGSSKKINFYQELLILFWKFCDYNKKFMYFVLKSSEVLDILVPILYFLVDSREDSSKIGLMHICVFILLLLSGERNFGVRLNKPYVSKIPIDIPIFSGTYADLLIVVFHKLITTTNNRLHPLYDCLLTIIANISPYLKTLSMVSSTKLLHLIEAFSNYSFLFSNQSNYYLIFFLLEILNNIIQYQFDGNANLIYTIIRKRYVFFNLLNLQGDQKTIDDALEKRFKKNDDKNRTNDSVSSKSMEGALTAKEAEPGTLKTTLAETPSVLKMTEKMNSLQHKEDLNVTEKSFKPETASNDSETIDESTIYLNYNKSDTSINKQKNSDSEWTPTIDWITSWKNKLPLQTIMRLLQVLVPQVEKICIDKGLTDESEILKFLQNGTLVGLLPVPHPILIRKYQPNLGTIMWLKTYMWGVIYLRNLDPPIWYDTDVKLFEIQKV